jgi:hypothetical protein
MRFPAGGGAGVYNFVMTFVVLEGGATRVTRSPEESTANANTRAGNVTTSPATTVTKVLIDDPAVNITADYTVQNNLKIGTGASQTLLKPAKLVLARVSAGGGYAGTPFVYNSDFVEIFNAGELSASLNGMTLQIANLSVELGATGIVDVSALGILSPGQYKLVSTTSKNTNDTTVTPASEIATIWNVNFNFANAVRVALVNQTTALGCGGVTVNGTASVVCTSTQNSKIVDLLAYKKATSTVVLVQYEGTTFFSFPTDSGELAFSRKDKGCLDVNQNSTDFFVETLNLIPPNPIVSARNGSTTPFICP